MALAALDLHETEKCSQVWSAIKSQYAQNKVWTPRCGFHEGSREISHRDLTASDRSRESFLGKQQIELIWKMSINFICIYHTHTHIHIYIYISVLVGEDILGRGNMCKTLEEGSTVLDSLQKCQHGKAYGEWGGRREGRAGEVGWQKSILVFSLRATGTHEFTEGGARTDLHLKTLLWLLCGEHRRPRVWRRHLGRDREQQRWKVDRLKRYFRGKCSQTGYVGREEGSFKDDSSTSGMKSWGGGYHFSEFGNSGRSLALGDDQPCFRRLH